MMRRPWQIWTVYGVCLTSAVAALAWLTHMARQLDRSEMRARAEAALEEQVGDALWTLDVELTRLLATEAGRPPSAYEPFLPSMAKGLPPAPSPLLVQPSELVLLHFQIDARGQWTSPQCPERAWLDVALANGTNRGLVADNQGRLDTLAASSDRAELLAVLPTEMVDSAPYLNALATNNALLSPQQAMLNSFPNDSQIPGQQAANPEAFTQNDNELAQLQQRNFNNRANAVRGAAQQSLMDQRLPLASAAGNESLGISQPIWHAGRLLLARRYGQEHAWTVQGCWLDWERIRELLLSKIDGTLPGADLQPVSPEEDTVSRRLATLPVRLITPAPALTSDGRLTPMSLALMIAWACLAAAAGAFALLMHGVVQLSERRAAFVSAVTHELRTPLTTFRMYSEMLTDGIVREPQKQQAYLETLRLESERLCHLVDNVLQYARLERTSGARNVADWKAGELLGELRQRLADRARQGDMELDLILEPSAAGAVVRTDAGAVEQILFNLVDNACKYASQSTPRRIELRLEPDGDGIRLVVRDFGDGVPAEIRQRMFRPFSRPAQEVSAVPGVGLGLALCRRLARQLKGRLSYESADPGAAFCLRLPT